MDHLRRGDLDSWVSGSIVYTGISIGHIFWRRHSRQIRRRNIGYDIPHVWWWYAGRVYYRHRHQVRWNGRRISISRKKLLQTVLSALPVGRQLIKGASSFRAFGCCVRSGWGWTRGRAVPLVRVLFPPRIGSSAIPSVLPISALIVISLSFLLSRIFVASFFPLLFGFRAVRRFHFPRSFVTRDLFELI